MPERFTFEADEREVATRATQILLNAYIKEQGAVPDLFPFQKPFIYDNALEYEDTTLNILMKAVNAAVFLLFSEQNPGREILGARLPAEVLERIVWAIFGALKLAPLFSKRGRKFESFELSDSFGMEGHLDMTHNRVAGIKYERLQETYDTFMKVLAGLLNDRYSLLEVFLLAKNSDEGEKLLPHMQQCCQSIDEIRKDIVCFCEKHKFLNPFTPPEEKEQSSFEQAIHWNDNQSQSDTLDSFLPSLAERSLFHFLPKDFEQCEWPLFQFHFTEDDTDEDYSQGDIHSFRENQYERKMLVLYYASMHLLLHRRGTVTLSPDLADSTKKNVSQLQNEIEDVSRIQMNGGADSEDIIEAHEDGKLATYDIAHIDELAITTQNIIAKIDISETDIRVLQILERLSEYLNAFFRSALTIRRDDDLDNLDKKEIIQTFRDELLGNLGRVREDIQNLAIDDEGLDRAEDIISRAMVHLTE